MNDTPSSPNELSDLGFFPTGLNNAAWVSTDGILAVVKQKPGDELQDSMVSFTFPYHHGFDDDFYGPYERPWNCMNRFIGSYRSPLALKSPVDTRSVDFEQWAGSVLSPKITVETLVAIGESKLFNDCWLSLILKHPYLEFSQAHKVHEQMENDQFSQPLERLDALLNRSDVPSQFFEELVYGDDEKLCELVAEHPNTPERIRLLATVSVMTQSVVW